MELLGIIEQLAPARALRASFYAYPLVNAAHILSIGMLLASVILMDLRILGFLAAQEYRPFLKLMRRAALIAFCGALATGLPMFAIRAGEYFHNPAFRLKMALIGLAGLNLLALRLFVSGSDGTASRHPAAKLAAALSILLWLGVLVCGRFIGFV
ncbi:DUF6644 family protein [Chelativorans sp. AA-79]|uniref:DUF6644 family protein n=1 Tax=Chelativorans sp. AA-79 TaxID=3028735 RepID=UPI0023F6C6E1|nr:DUF6644 family protein [Chelativorans sp. AA-79]WEX09882.1 hypothetical protein PVE73_02640 [Chelativorans sp. AA-79]